MPIIAKGGSGGKFEPCPAGMQQAVCCDVIDLGIMETTFGQKWKIDIRWQSADLMSDERPYIINKRYTLSLNEKATLRHDLESWRGRPFNEAEIEGFDVERLIGANCLLNVVHKQGSKGGTFANVVSITPIMRSMVPIKVTADYVRVTARPTTPEASQTGPDDDSQVDRYEDVGF